MKFIVESSGVPIYNRIAVAFAQALQEFGHTVYFIDASGFSELDFIHTINNIDIDFYFSTNELNYIQKKSSDDDLMLFEKIRHKKIFIHHDNVFSGINDLKEIESKISALSRCRESSHHFFLEESNVEKFKQYGMMNSYKINHASEFTQSDIKMHDEINVSFVGHLMSSLGLYPWHSFAGGIHLQALAWQRLSHSSYEIQPNIHSLSNDQTFLESIGVPHTTSKFAIQQFLTANLNKLSSPYRGELISSLKKIRIDIFGGDLSYGKLKDPLMKIDQPNVYYHSATQDYQQSSSIYRSSRINLNISALQFDSAVNNRIIDIVAAGGFVITDKRSDLFRNISVANEICFESPEEMHFLINYFSDKKNNHKYQELKTALSEEISQKYSYQKSLTHILDKLS